MPQVFVEPGGTDFAQGAIGLGQGLLAGMQIKQSMDLDRQRADMLRAQLMEERRARQVYEGQRQQALDMDREELRFRREDRTRRRESEMGLVETALSSLERTLGDDPATEDLRAEIGIAKARLAPEHLQPYLEQIQSEIEMRLAPQAAEQMSESLDSLATLGIVDEGQAAQWKQQMARYVESGGADGMDPDMVGQMADQVRQQATRQSSLRRHAETTAANYDQYIDQMPLGSEEQALARFYQDQILTALDEQEIAGLKSELNRIITGEGNEDWARQQARLDAQGHDFLDANERVEFLDARTQAYMQQRRGGSLRSQQEPAQKPTRGVPDVDKEKLRQALMEALGEGTEQAPRSSSRKTKEEMGGGFLDTIGSIGKAIGGGGAKAAEALGEGMDRASQVRRSRGSRKPQAESKPKPTQKAPEGDEEVRRELRRAEAKLRRLRQGHPDEKAIEATKKLIAELKAKLGG